MHTHTWMRNSHYGNEAQAYKTRRLLP